MLFFSSDYLEIYYFATDKLVETRWLTFAPSDEYKKGLGHYLDVILKKEVKYWLGDYRLAHVIRQEDQQWAAQNWFPRFLPLALGIERMAKVQALDIFSQMSSDSMKERLDIKGLPFLFSEFKDYDAAKAWLFSGPDDTEF